MRAVKFGYYWARYALALAVVVLAIAVALPLAVVMKLGTLAEAVIDWIGTLDLFPSPRGLACKACRGRGRVVPREPDDDDDESPLQAARRRAAYVEPPSDNSAATPTPKRET